MARAASAPFHPYREGRLMRCPKCSSTDVARLQFRFEHGVVMGWCRRCEERWWQRDGSLVCLEEVLRAAGTIKRVV
jgi:hypothetical protein